MSKEAAMAIMTGQPVTAPVNPSLVVGEMKETGLTPGVVASEAKPEEVVQSVNASDGIAKQAKKDAELYKREKEYKEKVAAHEEKIKKADEILKRIEAFEAKKKENPVAALGDIGFTETDILNWLAATDKKYPSPEDVARSAANEEIKKFKDEQARLQAETQAGHEKAVLGKYYAQVETTFKSDKDKFEFSNYKLDQAKKDAAWVATEAVKDGGEPLDPKDVAEIVEAMYEGEWESMKALKKVKGKTEEAQASVLPNGVKVEPQRTRTVTPPIGAQPSKTLTNKVTATVASQIPRRESSEQKRERMINNFKSGAYETKQ